MSEMTPQEESDWLQKFHPSQRALASRQLREKREERRKQQRIEELARRVEALERAVFGAGPVRPDEEPT